MRTNKKGLEFSFAWLFAIIVGAVILFMAIYSVKNLSEVGDETSSTITGQRINVFFNILETGFESSSITYFTLPLKTRIYNDCDTKGYFGTQKFAISEFKREKWSEPSGEGEFYNKYIFSEDFVEGTKFWLFTKPFEPLFKVNDYIYIIPEGTEYCFVDAPEEIEKEIENINKSFMKIENHASLDCDDDSIKVCFQGGDCDIEVDIKPDGGGSIKKDSETMYFIGDEEDNGMIFAGIFSSPEIYECQMKRMMKRMGILGDLYMQEINYVERVGCNSNVELRDLIEAAKDYEESEDLYDVGQEIKRIKGVYGDFHDCGIW